ncbi:MAG TPA: hypothetical protein VFA09_19420 [Ktedonobacteraceae bacterium]|jgi:hypothetical protein|nr:hypothetical protein [Ktedonobacteraceae bacterium]
MNFSRQMLASGPHIPGHVLQHCDETRTIVIDGGVNIFSRTDYALLMLLLQYAQDGQPFVPFTDLALCFQQLHSNPRRSLSKRINSIRERLWPYGLDIVNREIRDILYLPALFLHNRQMVMS